VVLTVYDAVVNSSELSLDDVAADPLRPVLVVYTMFRERFQTKDETAVVGQLVSFTDSLLGVQTECSEVILRQWTLLQERRLCPPSLEEREVLTRVAQISERQFAWLQKM
jgi:hypothetical protein